MKIFISWSGELSHKVALKLREWLPSVIQGLNPYVSSEDIEKGAPWFGEILGNLETSAFGIACLTKENVNKPWVLFEAGAIMGKLGKSFFSPLVIDLTKGEVKPPLGQLQATNFEKDDVFKLLETINKLGGDKQLADNLLKKSFEMWWQDLHNVVDMYKTGFAGGDAAATIPIRPDREMLEEILELDRNTSRTVNILANFMATREYTTQTFKPNYDLASSFADSAMEVLPNDPRATEYLISFDKGFEVRCLEFRGRVLARRPYTFIAIKDTFDKIRVVSLNVISRSEFEMAANECGLKIINIETTPPKG